MFSVASFVFALRVESGIMISTSASGLKLINFSSQNLLQKILQRLGGVA